MMTSTSDRCDNSGGGKKNRLGGVFANVRSTRNLVEEQNKKHEWKDSLTLRCEGCGAPQEVGGDIRCQYCGGRIVRSEESHSEGDGT